MGEERDVAEPARGERLRVQSRRPRSDGWTEERRQRFFAALADSCNIKHACRVVRMSVGGAYQLRDRDASFRAGWRRALAQAYAKLEMMMLERALIGERRLRGALDAIPDDRDAVDFLSRASMRVTETLYRSHRAEAIDHDLGDEDDPDGEKARASIEAKLALWRERLAEKLDGR